MLKRITLFSLLLLSVVLSSSCTLDQSNPTNDELSHSNNSDTQSSIKKVSNDESKAPRGDLPNWKQVFVDDFDEYGNVPVGSFSDCDQKVSEIKQSNCNGLRNH